MRAYKGLVKEGKIILVEGASLPEGATVTVTMGETEYLKASLRSALLRNRRRQSRAKLAVPALSKLS